MAKVHQYRGIFKGLFTPGGFHREKKFYPLWLYREDTEPILVSDEDEEKEAKQKGYDSIRAADMSNRHLINWFWDLEDFSVNQLHVFAKEEYGVNLPVEAGQESLFKAVIELTRCAPQNRNRLIFMAHTIKMNYDATLEEIRRMADSPPGTETERFYEEFTA